MSTNFYLSPPQCPCCGHQAASIHLGKSSVGWTFGLHVRPEENINNWQDIINLIKEKQADYWSIRDEYGESYSFAQFVDVVCNRTTPRKIPKDSEWLVMNYAQPGPNNLIRRQLGKYCIGHGDGTYDYLVGEFS